MSIRGLRLVPCHENCFSSLGILPLDTECPGCAEYCTVPEYYLGTDEHICV